MRKQIGKTLGLLLVCACLFSACKGTGGEEQPPVSSSASLSGESESAAGSAPSQSGAEGSESAPPQSGDDASDNSAGGSASQGGPTPAQSSGAQASTPAQASSKPSQGGNAATVKPGPIKVKTPSASGTEVYEGNGAVIDASHMSEGYIMVKCESTAPRLKLQVKFGDYTYNYDLNKEGRYEVFPLQGGSASYTVRVMENVAGTKYQQLYSATLNPQISNAHSPFLYPNQFVNFSASSKAVKKSYELCAGASTDLQKVEAVYSYITENITYDSGKAEQAQAGQLSGYLPNVDSTLSSGQGICFDYAALMAAMLRAQNIPTKLVIGTVSPGNISHAWNLVYTKEKGWIAYKIEFTGGGWKLMDSTFGASQGQNIEAYIGNGGNYTQLRVY